MNKTLLRYLKKIFTMEKGKWVDELSVALWAYRKTLMKPIGEKPYALAFGSEAQIPIEFELKPLRSNKHAQLEQALNELEEKRE